MAPCVSLLSKQYQGPINRNKTQCEQKYALTLAVKLTGSLRMFQQSTPDLWVRATNNPPKSVSK